MSSDVGAKWIRAIEAAFPDGSAASKERCKISRIAPFLGHEINYLYYPGYQSGNEIRAVMDAHEDGCIELLGRGNDVDLIKPSRISFTYIENAPVESFFMIKLASLNAIGPGSDKSIKESGREDVVEIAPEKYVSMNRAQSGYLGHDDYGKEIPIPANARSVTRWLGGSMLLVSKASFLNSYPELDLILRSDMSADEIKDIIQSGRGISSTR